MAASGRAMRSAEEQASKTDISERMVTASIHRKHKDQLRKAIVQCDQAYIDMSALESEFASANSEHASSMK